MGIAGRSGKRGVRSEEIARELWDAEASSVTADYG
jgi:hypothetical protein